MKKNIRALILGFIHAGFMDLTMFLQNLTITYLFVAVSYYLSFYILSRNRCSLTAMFVYLSPLLLLNIIFFMNVALFPKITPTTFLIPFVIALITHYTLNKKYSFIYGAIPVICVVLFSFFVLPKLTYTKTIEKNISKVRVNFEKYSIIDLRGNKVDPEYFTNKIILIDTWFYGCKPCMTKFSSMIDLEGKELPVEIIALSFNDIDSLYTIQDFAKKSKYPFTFFHVMDTLFKSDFDITGYPTQIIVDRNGFIREVQKGFNKDMENAYVSEVQKTLKRIINER